MLRRSRILIACSLYPVGLLCALDRGWHRIQAPRAVKDGGICISYHKYNLATSDSDGGSQSLFFKSNSDHSQDGACEWIGGIFELDLILCKQRDTSYVDNMS